MEASLNKKKMLNLKEIWSEFQGYDGTGAKNFQLPDCRVQFYKGAMEIPLIAFFPKDTFNLEEKNLTDFSQLLSEIGYELDCVEEGGNYKINRSKDGQYLGRITKESLKLHAERIKELGWDAFSKIVSFQLSEISSQPSVFSSQDGKLITDS